MDYDIGYGSLISSDYGPGSTRLIRSLSLLNKIISLALFPLELNMESS